MKITLAVGQIIAIQSAMRQDFEAWKAQRLEVRANHLKALVDDNTGNIDLIRLKQNAIRSIDLEIRDRSSFLDSLIRAINLTVRVKGSE